MDLDRKSLLQNPIAQLIAGSSSRPQSGSRFPTRPLTTPAPPLRVTGHGNTPDDVYTPFLKEFCVIQLGNK